MALQRSTTRWKWNDRIKLRHLRVALAIVDNGSASAAALELAISQAAVSKTISELEAAFGTDLFQKSGRGIKPTEAGRRFLRSARRIANEVYMLDEEIEHLAVGGTGLLRVGMQALSLQEPLVEAISTMKTNHPGTSIQIKDGILPDLLAGLRSGSLDLVLGRMVSSLLLRDLEGTMLTNPEPYLIIASSKHPVMSSGPVSWATCLQESWILPVRETPLRRHFDEYVAQQLLPSPSKAVETNSIPLIRRLISAFPAVTLVPEDIALEWIAEKIAVPTGLKLCPQPDPIGLIWRRDVPLSAPARLFKRILTDKD